MIAGIFHAGSGLGDQLHRYITVRTLAESKGLKWGMFLPENFKGSSFMQLELPPIDPEIVWEKTWSEKDVRDVNGVDIRSYDPEINFVEDNTIIDGYFEDSKYWGHNLDNIRDWLRVEPIDIPDDVCVIGFRGGEFYSDPDLGLPKQYYTDAMRIMYARNNSVKFEVHTDDPVKAKEFFPHFPIIHDIGINWRSMRYAHHAIIANSAFYIMSRQLLHYDFRTQDFVQEYSHSTIAPRYWARRNTKTWARPSSYYPQFQYI